MNNQNTNENGYHRKKPTFQIVPNEIAEKMFEHYLDPEVNHSLDHIVRNIYFDTKTLETLLKGKFKTIKFITAAYLDDDPDEKRRNAITILIQLKTHHKTEDAEAKHVGAAGARSGQTVYYDLQTARIGRSGFCPPPTVGCYL